MSKQTDKAALTGLTIAQARGKLQKGEIKAVELAQAYNEAIDGGNEALNVYVARTSEQALEQAKLSDERLAAGKGRPLEGIPLGVKDLFATKGVHSQSCSHILDGFKPPYESTVTANLWQDGALMLGKLNMDELAMGSSNESSYYGPAVNPWRRERSEQRLVPGGSSGGSSAAVAAHLCAGATATDTGGSIRQPAAFTATVGLKPTYGRCSRYGMFAFASSLDQAGTITRNVRDAAIMLRSMASYDPKDSTSIDAPVPDYEAFLGKSVKGMKIGIPKEYCVDGMPAEIDRLWKKGCDILRAAGAEIVQISLPHTKYALATYYIIAPAEASSNLARYDGVRYGLRVPGKDIVEMYENSRAKGFGHEVQRRILIGTYVLSSESYEAFYVKAQRVRRLIKQDFDNVFAEGVDAVLTPATPTAAFAIGDEKQHKDPVAMYLNDVFTVPVNMAGLPAISIPAGLSENGSLPLGLQLIGHSFEEAKLLQLSYVLEQECGHFTAPKWW